MKDKILGWGCLAVFGFLAGFRIAQGEYLLAVEAVIISGLAGYEYLFNRPAFNYLRDVLERANAILLKAQYRNHRLHRRVIRQMALVEEQRQRLAEIEVSDDEVAHFLVTHGNFGAHLYELWTAAVAEGEKTFIKSSPLWKYAQAQAVVSKREEKHAD